jgi:FMN phosphatase YigB (HAD superfamily)
MIGMHVDIPRDEIIDEMKRDCENLSFNEEVMNFAERQRCEGKKIALVTANMDIFTEIVVPAHDLNNKFDVIVNSADFKTDDKLQLWPIAFEAVGANVDYECSLLIDDSEKWVRRFRNANGQAYQY